ncbi:hypothetical protein CS379_28305, partial [Methylobacterium frigidaeris]
LLIVDYRLPGLPGHAFARRAAALLSRPIVLSLSASDTVRPDVLSAIPVVDVTRRPWRSSALALTLQRHLVPEARRAAPRPEVAEV